MTHCDKHRNLFESWFSSNRKMRSDRSSDHTSVQEECTMCWQRTRHVNATVQDTVSMHRFVFANEKLFNCRNAWRSVAAQNPHVLVMAFVRLHAGIGFNAQLPTPLRARRDSNVHWPTWILEQHVQTGLNRCQVPRLVEDVPDDALDSEVKDTAFFSLDQRPRHRQIQEVSWRHHGAQLGLQSTKAPAFAKCLEPETHMHWQHVQYNVHAIYTFIHPSHLYMCNVLMNSDHLHVQFNLSYTLTIYMCNATMNSEHLHVHGVWSSTCAIQSIIYTLIIYTCAMQPWTLIIYICNAIINTS